MSAIGCNDFLNRLEGLLEGDPDEEGRAHTRTCPSCRGLLDDLRTIEHSGQELGAEQPEPPERVWIALRDQLEREGLIQEKPEGRLAGFVRWVENAGRSVRGPALAGAYMALLVAGAFALGRPVDSRFNIEAWAQNMESATRPLSAQLDTDEEATVSYVRESDPVVTASLHENLAIVDNDIALCEKSVREDPDSEVARDYLYEAYQQKADLLAQMSERDIQ